MERGGRDSTYTRSRLDVVLAENKQLKKRAEAAERDNRELKISVYELGALPRALARNEKLSRALRPSGVGRRPPRPTGISPTRSQTAASSPRRSRRRWRTSIGRSAPRAARAARAPATMARRRTRGNSRTA